MKESSENLLLIRKQSNINFTARATEVRRGHLHDLAALENSTTALQLAVVTGNSFLQTAF